MCFALLLFFVFPRRLGSSYLSILSHPIFLVTADQVFKTIVLHMQCNLCWRNLEVLRGVGLLNLIPSIDINK